MGIVQEITEDLTDVQEKIGAIETTIQGIL